MLGLLAGLGELLNKVLNFVFSKLIQNILVPVIKVLLQVVITVIQYFGAALFYELSVFILKLIDFVEVLFRALAGLSSNNGTMGAEFSLNGKSGDLLLQFITHKDVLDVFFACAIVGIFLLMITTVFQIVKVEYTTEGANNSKTTILNKSFKALVNMLMIPIMVVLGVFIGNQVLELIDTATGGGENARISGCLWVTSASTAMLKEPGTLAKALEEIGVDFGDGANAGELIGAGVSLAITEGFTMGLRELFDSDEKSLMESVKLGDPSNRVFIEENFMAGVTLKYSDLNAVVKFYNPFEVNYLVLIFAGCLILKCLFNCCFGMIDRLYRCTALFIVMPLAVGMAPVKDNLGSWRSSFMSKALSAYGIVISMNIFFTIVRVMLEIDITFTGDFTALPFPNSFMVGLVKSLMVIVGCLMIEKLAGDMGSYFGGGNAAADGAGLAKEATAGLQKAAVVAGGVGSLALKGAKVAGGIAGKVGKYAFTGGKAAVQGIGSAISKGKAKKANAELSGMMKKSGIEDSDLETYRSFKDEQEKQQGIIDSTQSQIDAIKNEDLEAQKVISDPNSSLAERAAARKKQADNKSKITSLEKTKKNAIDQKQAADDLITESENNNSAIKKAYDLSKVADKKNEKADSRQAALAKTGAKVKADAKADFVEPVKNLPKNAVWKVGAAGSAVSKMLGDTFNMGNVFKTLAPGALKNLPGNYSKAREEANAVNPIGKQMLENEKQAKAKKAEKGWANTHRIITKIEDSQQSKMISTMMVQKVEIANQDLNTKLDKLAKGYNQAKASNNVDDMNYFLNQMRALNSSVTRPADKFEINNNATYRVNFDMADFKKNLAEAIKKHASAEKLESMLQDQLKKWGQEGNAKLLSELHKALEEIKNTVGK